MKDILLFVENELKNTKKVPLMDHYKTTDIRKITGKILRNIEKKSNDYVFSICDILLEQRNWHMGVIAYDLAYRLRNQYDKKHLMYLKIG